MIFSRFFCAALVVCGSLGLFLGTANPFFHVPGAVLVYPACLLLASRGRHPFRLGWCVGIPGAAGALYWIAVAAHMYGGFPWLLAAPCSILLGMYVALWGGLFCFCASRLLGLPAWKRSLALGLLWFLLEWTRGWFCTGFSWLTLSSGLAAWPVLMQPLSVLGEYGYSGLLAAVTFLLCEGVLCRRENRRDGVRLLASGACIAAAVVVFGAWRMQALPEKLAAEGVPVACTMVQGSVRQDVKWSPEYQQQTLEHYIRLSVEGVRAAMNGLAGTGRGPGREEIVSSLGLPLGSRPDAALAPALPDFILWPETAMPFAYPASPLSRELNVFADGLGIPLIFGAPGVERRAGEATALFNRAFMLLPEGDAVHYDKEHLVPFVFHDYRPVIVKRPAFQKRDQGYPLHRRNLVSVPFFRIFGSRDFHQSRHYIYDVGIRILSQCSPQAFVYTVTPGNYERSVAAALVRMVLVEEIRGIGGIRPIPSKINGRTCRSGIRTFTAAFHSGLGISPVVRHKDNQRIVEFAFLFEPVEDFPYALVNFLYDCSIDRHLEVVPVLFFICQGIPVRCLGIQGRKLPCIVEKPHLPLLYKTGLPDFIPAAHISAPVFGYGFRRSLEREMRSHIREIPEKRLAGIQGFLGELHTDFRPQIG